MSKAVRVEVREVAELRSGAVATDAVQSVVDACRYPLHEGSGDALHDPGLVHVDDDAVRLASPGVVRPVSLVLHRLANDYNAAGALSAFSTFVDT